MKVHKFQPYAQTHSRNSFLFTIYKQNFVQIYVAVFDIVHALYQDLYYQANLNS